MPDPKLSDPRFRPLLRKVTPGYQERLDEEEGLYDRARLGSGQRILERLNRGLGYWGNLYGGGSHTGQSFGGLTPTPPPRRVVPPPLIKGPSTSEILESDL